MVAAATAILALGGGLFTQVQPPPAAAAASSQFKGVNWADQRDNYTSDPIILSGLSRSDDYSTVKVKAKSILQSFVDKTGANTVRLPVNPYSVGNDWWNSYTGAIDAASEMGLNVILGYWEGPVDPNGGKPGDDLKDGKVDDLKKFWKMWTTVTTKYTSNSRVYFEPMNEPFGYSLSEWSDLAAEWISAYPSIPKNRIVVGGTGYSENVTGVCADSRLNGTYLALHVYGFWKTQSYLAWLDEIKGRIGDCSSRTILDELGAPMNTGLDYNNANPTGSLESKNFIAYFQAMTDSIRTLGIGSVYWPGLRTGDSYSLTTLTGSGTDLSLRVASPSGLDRLTWGWGSGSAVSGFRAKDASPAITAVGARRCLDVAGESRSNGASVTIYDCSGKENQKWTETADKELRIYGNMCLDAVGEGTQPGTSVAIYNCTGGENQKWKVSSSGTITGVQSGLCLEVPGEKTTSGTKVGLWTCSGGSHQRWTHH